MMRSSPHGRDLIELGFGEDIDLAARLDSLPVVAKLEGGGIVAAG
jgi:phosphosulfolactate phosphohydrolase-like enzyme